MGADNPAVIHPKTSIVVVLITGFLAHLDTRRQNEDILLANLGARRSVIVGLMVGPATVFEIVTGVVSRL
ncbi:MAG: hypothetical protein ACT443_03225 [Gemmatimonadota bacterium]